MNNCENTGKSSFISAAFLIISVLSFILGAAAGAVVTKTVIEKKKSKKSCCDTSFDADEYVRSLNLD